MKPFDPTIPPDHQQAPHDTEGQRRHQEHQRNNRRVLLWRQRYIERTGREPLQPPAMPPAMRNRDRAQPEPKVMLHADISTAEIFAVCNLIDARVVTWPDGRHVITPRTAIVRAARDQAANTGNVIRFRTPLRTMRRRTQPDGPEAA